MTLPSSKVVWHISSNRWNSAITEYALSCANALRGKGFQTVFSPLKNSIAEHRAQGYGLNVKSFKDFGLAGITTIKRLNREIKPDIIFVYGGQETFLTKFITSPRVKVYRVRGQAYEAPVMAGKFLNALSYSHCQKIIAPCDVIKQQMAGMVNIPIETVILGCDSKVFFPYESLESPSPNERPEIVNLGRLDPIKGHKRLMAIMRHVLDRWPNKKSKPLLHVIGLPANLSEVDIAKYAEQAGLVLGEDVKISAQRMNPIAEYLTKASLGIVPSIDSELICRVSEEFLLCGTPLIVSGAGALEEVLFDSAGASYKGLSDADAAELIVKWLEKSLSEGQHTKKMRAERAKQLFSLNAMAENLVKVIAL
jgi:glycosyltransferase involved in cell wall biosynthesis